MAVRTKKKTTKMKVIPVKPPESPHEELRVMMDEQTKMLNVLIENKQIKADEFQCEIERYEDILSSLEYAADQLSQF